MGNTDAKPMPKRSPTLSTHTVTTAYAAQPDTNTAAAATMLPENDSSAVSMEDIMTSLYTQG